MASGDTSGGAVRAVDTNVLVRLITRDDPRQAAAADRFVEQGAWVSHIVLVEATWVLASVYDCSASDVATALDMLLDHHHLTVQDPDVVAAAVEYFRQRPSLGFSDCLVIEVARKAGHLPLGTFDRQLARIDGAQRL
jgi:predicted nucleic-acid-binding protein